MYNNKPKNFKLLVIIITILSFFLILSFYFLFKENSDNSLKISDYKNNTQLYVDNLTQRLDIVGYNDNLTNENIKDKLIMVDGLYKEGLINATEELYYLPSTDCSKKPCFSIRETYLFNFNFD